MKYKNISNKEVQVEPILYLSQTLGGIIQAGSFIIYMGLSFLIEFKSSCVYTFERNFMDQPANVNE